jgi:hypothetical protein
MPSTPPSTDSASKPTAFPKEFWTNQKLPKQVFSNATGWFLFFEYGRVFSEGAWRLFARLARESGDSTVWFKCIEPDAQCYYLANFGAAAEFAFSAGGNEDGYVARMHKWPPTSVADAVAYRGDIAAWAGSTGKWSCWGERESGLCVLSVSGPERLRKELILLPDDYVPLVELGDALRDIASREIARENFDWFAQQMQRSYAVKA